MSCLKKIGCLLLLVENMLLVLICSVKVQIHAFERKLYILNRWGFEFAQVRVAFECIEALFAYLYFFMEFQFKMQTCFKCEIHNFSSTLILGLTS